MNSREKILAAVKQHNSGTASLPELAPLYYREEDPLTAFRTVLEFIGGHLVEVSSPAALPEALQKTYPGAGRIVSVLPALRDVAAPVAAEADPHSFENVDVAVLAGRFGVAENGAVWITEEEMIHRALPFICTQLALVLPAGAIVSTMHDAYEKIGAAEQGFGVFIAGPSKTSDIEQSLVLGAHGPKGMTVFLVKEG
ncbi:LutC/YkgG family protein [Compostibacter hankyongensis]|uniref:LUD domain-containing protein n=1 Tax=Compostibacter hankyongensis TaxID=1007089 RepID=A0ABP8FQI6_9BACT